MPELPEVETVVRTLEKSLLNEVIEEITLVVDSLLEKESQALEELIGASFEMFDRRGKYLIFGFSNRKWLIVHLRMEGKFHLYAKGAAPKPSKHTHMIIETKKHTIHYLDVRKFSRMALIEDLDIYLQSKKLGFEPFDEGLTSTYLKGKYASRKKVIKGVLLDQSIIAGIGNIYADEILFDASLNPLRSANSLTLKECDKIIVSTRKVLSRAIKAGGTTIRSYTSSLNVSGLFQINLNVYGRKGLECTVCSTVLEGIKIDGRSCVYCPKCQKVSV